MGEKLRGKLGTIFYVGIIPILFTIIFAAILLNFFGVPVWKTFQEWGNKLPIVHNIIPNSKPALAENSGDIDYWKEQYSISEGQLKEMDQKIGELNNQLDSNQNDLEVIKKENDTLQKQLENKQTQEVQDQLKQVAIIYKNIPDSKAAAMLGSMPLDEASLTISILKQDQQSSILGSMKDAKKAAQITMMLKEIAMLKGTDQTTLKEQIHELALQQESPKDTLAETIAGMPAVHSASIIQSMLETNSQVAMELMGNISTTSRSQILTEIAKVDAKLAATIAGNLH
jgi:flagellar motility protein MotE (MotC chaperone)